MARATSSSRRDARLDRPKGLRSNFSSRFTGGNGNSGDRFGRFSESFARAMGTTWFLFGLTLLVIVWLLWNSIVPVPLQFDPRLQNFTLLTLILSLQASYAAPLILLAQNRQTDRDRVAAEQDRQSAERNLADTEYVAREMAALRIAIGDVATRDFVRSEIRNLLEELAADRGSEKEHRHSEQRRGGSRSRETRDSKASEEHHPKKV